MESVVWDIEAPSFLHYILSNTINMVQGMEDWLCKREKPSTSQPRHCEASALGFVSLSRALGGQKAAADTSWGSCYQSSGDNSSHIVVTETPHLLGMCGSHALLWCCLLAWWHLWKRDGFQQNDEMEEKGHDYVCAHPLLSGCCVLAPCWELTWAQAVSPISLGKKGSLGHFMRSLGTDKLQTRAGDLTMLNHCCRLSHRLCWNQIRESHYQDLFTKKTKRNHNPSAVQWVAWKKHCPEPTEYLSWYLVFSLFLKLCMFRRLAPATEHLGQFSPQHCSGHSFGFTRNLYWSSTQW